jgi:hypothetical protein
MGRRGVTERNRYQQFSIWDWIGFSLDVVRRIGRAGRAAIKAEPVEL